jgi:hypothetical protein
MLNGVLVIDFDPTDPATQYFMYSDTTGYKGRTFPFAAKRQAPTDLDPYEPTIGFLNYNERYNIPNNNQKDAMDNAAAPSAANPFATESQSSNRYFGEPKRIVASLNPGTNYLDLTGTFYVGNGLAGSAEAFFAIMEPEQEDWAYEVDNNYPVFLIRMCKDGTTTQIDPSADADAEGFIVNPRVHYFTPATATQTVEILAFEKKQLKDLNLWPAYAMPQGGMMKRPHATQIVKTHYGFPPAAAPKGSFVQGALDTLEKSNRGYASPTRTNALVSQKAFWDTTDPDGQMFSIESENWHDVSPWAVWRTESWRDQYGELYLFLILVDASFNMRLGKYQVSTGILQTLVVDPFFGGGTHRIDAIAVDGDRVYVRAYNVSSRDDKIRALDAESFLFTGVWSSHVVVTNTAFVGDPPIGAAVQILCVDDDKIAVNLWNLNLVGGSPSTTAIKFYKKSDGSYVNGGSGDITTLPGWPYGAATVYARGPLCSDGSSLYWSTWRSDLVAEGPVVKLNIAAPTTSTPLQWTGNGASGGVTRALIYDGGYLWCVSAGEVSASLPKIALGGLQTHILQLTNPGDEFFGGACWDGKNMWVTYLNTSTGRFDIHKANPRRLKNRWSVGVNQYYAFLVENYAAPVNSLEAALISPLGWQTSPCFDGENIWYVPEGDPTEPGAGIIVRLPLVKFL